MSVMDEFFIFFGVTHYNYTHIDSTCQSKHFLFYHNYRESWVQRYIARNYETIDPAIIIAKLTNAISAWNQAFNTYQCQFILDKNKQNLLLDMHSGVNAENLHNGLIIPIISSSYKQHGFYLAFNTKHFADNGNLKSHISAACIIFNNILIALEQQSIKDKYHHNIMLSCKEKKRFPFTPRERELITLIYMGKERTDIAELMNIATSTVDTMTKRIFLKMRVNSKLQLIVKIISNGWVNVFLN